MCALDAGLGVLLLHDEAGDAEAAVDQNEYVDRRLGDPEFDDRGLTRREATRIRPQLDRA